MRRHLFLAWSVLSLVGCAETARTCPEGFWRQTGSDVCEPIADAGSFDGGADSGPFDGAVPDDAGPCGLCTNPSLPFCDEMTGACVQCGSGTDCADPTPLCEMSTHTCVQCTMDSQCVLPGAARCNAGECVGCTESSQCAGIGATLTCDPDLGECVTCHGLEAAACEVGHPCTTSNVCSAYPDDRITCQACDTDANCAVADHLCVPMNLRGTARGGYCLQKKGVPDCPRPWSVLITGRTSLSGETGFRYCGIDESVTTCEAVRALRDNVRCPPTGVAPCPEGGLCRTVGGQSDTCSYPCGSEVDCLASGAGSMCGGGGGTPADPDYCGWTP